MKCIVFVPYFPNPRMNKRYKILSEQYDTTLLYWNKSANHTVSKLDEYIKSCEINIPACQNNPFKRIFPLVKFIIRARKKFKEIKPEIIYVCEYEAMLAVLASFLFVQKKPNIIYEVGDINKLIIEYQPSWPKKAIQFILIFIEKVFCKWISLFVVTARDFFDAHYNKFVSQDKLMYMPNLPDLTAFSSFRKKNVGDFVVGYIGIIRYKSQLKMLISAGEKSNINLFFAGSSYDDEIEILCTDNNRISYFGEYDYNSQISELYGKVDCVYCVYDASLNNVKMALPNKLYEAIRCGLPVIVAKGTSLAKIVEAENIGIAVSHTNEQELVEALLKISCDRCFYQRLVENCLKFQRKVISYHYNEQFLSRIDEVIRTRYE